MFKVTQKKEKKRNYNLFVNNNKIYVTYKIVLYGVHFHLLLTGNLERYRMTLSLKESSKRESASSRVMCLTRLISYNPESIHLTRKLLSNTYLLPEYTIFRAS